MATFRDELEQKGQRSTEMSIKNRQEALAILAYESDQEYARLCERRKADELLYAPNPNDLHVWQLTIDRVYVGMGYRHPTTRTVLFLTREFAVRFACDDLHKTHIMSDSGYVYDKKLKALYDEGKFEELFESHNNYGDLSFKIQPTTVNSSGELSPISIYSEAEGKVTI